MGLNSGDSSEGVVKSRAPRIEGLSSAGYRVAIVASRFNDYLVGRLLVGALDALEQTGTSRKEVKVMRVPGAFELPLIAGRLAASGEYDAIIALGCVIRGETPHFEHVSRAAAEGLQRVSLDHAIPIGFGVLTTNTAEQAEARSGGHKGNSGFDAAVAAIEMVALLRGLAGR